eukprot:TRINITY_DN4595_c0_g1_i1.p1 TRINITY_DN4595_c0_g1~~TRINITY_DN4595_c0_g1_i1.p1  ORF type:complete len:159 (+),score=11.29 TRINITY_DN4595_c0_g1_i1:71-547(+)
MCNMVTARKTRQSRVASRLAGLLSALAKGGKRSKAMLVYDSKSVPDISVFDYLSRWVEYTDCSDDVLCIASLYLDRLMSKNNFSLNVHNVHRLLATSLVLASKWQHDVVYPSSHYALVCGVSVDELKRLERSFLTDLDWDLHVTTKQFQSYAVEFTKF